MANSGDNHVVLYCFFPIYYCWPVSSSGFYRVLNRRSKCKPFHWVKQPSARVVHNSGSKLSPLNRSTIKLRSRCRKIIVCRIMMFICHELRYMCDRIFCCLFNCCLWISFIYLSMIQCLQQMLRRFLCKLDCWRVNQKFTYINRFMQYKTSCVYFKTKIVFL